MSSGPLVVVCFVMLCATADAQTRSDDASLEWNWADVMAGGGARYLHVGDAGYDGRNDWRPTIDLGLRIVSLYSGPYYGAMLELHLLPAIGDSGVGTRHGLWWSVGDAAKFRTSLFVGVMNDHSHINQRMIFSLRPGFEYITQSGFGLGLDVNIGFARNSIEGTDGLDYYDIPNLIPTTIFYISCCD